MTIPHLRELLVDSGQTRQRLSYRADMITVVLSLWVLLGVFLDAWAHNNLAQLETFFTPWHAVLYSGFVALAGWSCWILWRGVRDGRAPLRAVAAVWARTDHATTRAPAAMPSSSDPTPAARTRASEAATTSACSALSRLASRSA